jgi:hypothetical protein
MTGTPEAVRNSRRVHGVTALLLGMALLTAGARYAP